jgi:epimerase transport system membrane fusion protein
MHNGQSITRPSHDDSLIIKLGFILLFIVFGVIGGWMAYAPLAATSVALGKVVPSSAKVVIQHLEGGIIDEILVKDGEEVRKNQPLIRLQDLQIRAQIGQINNQIEGLDSLLESKKKRIVALDEEILEWEKLFEQKLIDKQRIRELKKERVQVEGDIANTKSQIAKAIEQNIILKDKLKRTVISAPQNGTIMGLDIHTVGEVIGAGQRIFDIIPQSSKLIVMAQVVPTDIDKVHIGLLSDIIFPAFDMQKVPPIEGRVIYISADSVDDKQIQKSYYEAKIEITQKGIDTLKEYNLTLLAGMPSTVMIHIGDRTVLDYLIGPFKDMVRRGFNEE